MINRVPSSLLSVLGILSLLVVLPSCDSGGTNEPTLENEFSLTVTPSQSSSSAAAPKISEQREVNGFSFWVNTADLSNEEAPDAFAIYFSGGDSFSEQEVLQGTFGALGRTLAERPETGTYDLIGEGGGTTASSGFSGFMYENLSNTQSEPFYVFQSGTVEITTSTENEISGSFSGSALAFTFPSPDEINQESVQISGSFTATDVNNFIPLDSYSSPPSQ